eukprot:NODE_233_length_13658_cov_0.453647.p9 type:complete len:187 gc:universal NODE_233_length_13658_cov_0.453647:11437-10877(-)
MIEKNEQKDKLGVYLELLYSDAIAEMDKQICELRQMNNPDIIVSSDISTSHISSSNAFDLKNSIGDYLDNVMNDSIENENIQYSIRTPTAENLSYNKELDVNIDDCTVQPPLLLLVPLLPIYTYSASKTILHESNSTIPSVKMKTIKEEKSVDIIKHISKSSMYIKDDFFPSSRPERKWYSFMFCK